MKFIFLIIFCLLSCAQMKVTEYEKSIVVLQKIWDSNDLILAYKEISGLKVMAENEEYQTLGVPRDSGTSPLLIFYDKEKKKISGMSLSMYENGHAEFIKSKIVSEDWKTYVHSLRDHTMRVDVAEYSESKDVSFLYEKGDPKKNVRVIYWGADPKKINW